MKAVLYGTAQCHLCEEAEALFAQLCSVEWCYQDIMDDQAAFERFRYTIPVVAIEGQAATLDWPFNLDQLELFLASKTEC